MQASAASSFKPSHLRDALDLHQCILRQSSDLHGRTSRRNDTVSGEGPRVYLIHRGKVAHVFQEDRGLHNIREAEPRSSEHAAQVGNDALGLLGDAACDDLAGGWVQRNLAGGKYEVARADGLRVRADGGGSVGGGNGDLVDRHRPDCRRAPAVGASVAATWPRRTHPIPIVDNSGWRVFR